MYQAWKCILRTGRFWVQKSDGGTSPVEFTADDVRGFHAGGRQMLDRGFPVPVPLDHDDQAGPVSSADRNAAVVRNNAGWVGDYRLDEGTNGPELWARLDIDGPVGMSAADVPDWIEKRVKFVSPSLWPEITLGDGTDVRLGIKHVALTCQPIDFAQKPFGVALSTAGESVPLWSAAPMAVDLAWVNQPGPRSQNRWVNDETGRVVYSKTKPGSTKERIAAAEGDVDPKALKAALDPHERRELTAGQTNRARQAWDMLRRHHGDKAMHRVREMALADIEAIGRGETVNKHGASLYARLEAYRHMMGLAGQPAGAVEGAKEEPKAEPAETTPKARGLQDILRDTRAAERQLGGLKPDDPRAEGIRARIQALNAERAGLRTQRPQRPAPAKPKPTGFDPTQSYAVGGKEPWEMTAREWQDARDKMRPDDSGAGRMTPSSHAQHVDRVNRLTLGGNLGVDDDDGGRFPTSHGDVVKAALAAGKPVPPEVLTDYPDLAPKPQPAAQPAATPAPAAASTTKPGHPAYEAAAKAVRSAYGTLSRFKEHEGGMVPAHVLYDYAKDAHPGLTPEAFKAALVGMQDAKEVELHVRNEVKDLTPEQRNVTPMQGDKARGFVILRGKPTKMSHAAGRTVVAATVRATKRPARVQMSHGAGPMADEPEDDLFTDSELEGDDDTPADEGEGDDAAPAELEEVAAELASLGIVVEASKSKAKFLEHLITAVRSHKATRDGGTPQVDDAAARPEPEPMSMSMSKQMESRLARVEGELAGERLKGRLKEVAQLERAGVSPERCKRWKQTLQAKQLSLAGGAPDSDVGKVLAEMEMAKEAFAEKIQLSMAREEAEPDWARWNKADDDPAASRKRQEDVGDELAALAGVRKK